MTDAAIARLERVTHRYGRTFALNDLTLDIPAHCMVGMIGPDGVGKSTLLALVSGVRKIQSGRVTVLDGNMADERHRTASYGRIAYMPQGLGRNLYPTLSVFDNIDFFGRLFGQGAAERRARIDELLPATGLDPFAARPCGKLSGGMKQKVSLCCSLMHDPDLLVLDEPTTGVDPLSRRQFWELIDSIRARRPLMSVMVATAYMDEASRFDWLAAMDDGKVIARGAPKEILAQAKKTTLDDAFIALLPPEKRAQHQEVVVRPRVASDDQTPAIEADGLTRRFGDFVAVDHVSFSIARGEIFGFLGSNGSGKTTTMKMLTGLLPVTEGSAKLFGKPMGADDMEARRNVGYMSQAFSLYSELTVRQNLDLHAHLYHLPSNEIKGRINELLERYDLKSVADAKPESLPLGVKQRLQLAVAVLHRPRILILDEPTSGVDPITAGPGTLVFGQANTYIGKWNFAAKTNQVSNASALGTGANANVAAGAILDLTILGPTTFTPTTTGIGAQKRPIACFQAIRSWTTVGLCPARNHGAAARSHPAGVRVRRSCHSDVGLRVWHHLRRRKSQVRGL